MAAQERGTYQARTEVNVPTRIIAAAVTAIVLALSSPAFAQTHAARHHSAQHRSYGAQGSSQDSHLGRYYDVVPGPNVVLPNFGPTSGEDVSSLPFPVPQGHGR